MAVLAAPVALHDPECTGRPCLGATYCILDAEAFCQAALNASKRMYGPDEREDLVAEGLRILLELHKAFEPHREGYAQRGRLPGYCSKYVRVKLEDAYHRMHPEHRLVTQPNGKRRYEYGEKAVSMEALLGDDPDREPALADDHGARGEADGYVTVEEIAEKLGLNRAQFDAAVTEIRQLAQKLGSWANIATAATVAGLLRDRCEERYETGMRVAQALGRGLTADKEIGDELGITTIEVREARADLEPIATRLRTLRQQ